MHKMNKTARQAVILSGKGGTGKTCLCASLAHLASQSPSTTRAVLADADVDAANLGLVLGPDFAEEYEFWGGSLAEIDPELCTGCGACVSVCRYDAILHHNSEYQIDALACDGCAACVYACPQDAIRMLPQQEGVWFHSHTPYGDLFHAELFAGNENSGKLVTLVKQQARLAAEDTGCPLVIIDGPPGIGCPVISASAGADLAVIVAEPSVAGIHDLQRILDTMQHFHIQPLICINKADIYPPGCQTLKEFAAEHQIDVIGEIPFDPLIASAMVQGQPVTIHSPYSAASAAIRQFWDVLSKRLIEAED
jgi:MinD superfamily P-loop ATPase